MTEIKFFRKILGMDGKQKKRKLLKGDGDLSANREHESDVSQSPASYNEYYRLDETMVVKHLLTQINQSSEQSLSIADKARDLVDNVRSSKASSFSIENFLQTYSLNSQEGLALMCLAEALLRVPDEQTKIQLIRDKVGSVDWRKLGSQGDSKRGTFFAKVTSLGLSTADQLMHWGLDQKGFMDALGGLTRRLSEPVIVKSITKVMQLLGHQFVMGETIENALKRAKSAERKGYIHSYDMLGEAAHTKEDATRYYQSYAHAIETIGQTKRVGDIFSQPSISIKLSALHPRYELAQESRVQEELIPVVLRLAKSAKEKGIGLTIDAEESERLDLSLDVIETLSGHKDLRDWNGFGIAVQAYQKRAPFLIDTLVEMAKRHNRRLCIRLVKGAYWDSEIKRTQERGLKGYSVFTRKVFTDVSFQLCAQKMLAAPEAIYSQFATHNARTVATILELAGNETDFEFQRLHGMGDVVFNVLMKRKDTPIRCRVYAPVGEHRDLLAYLVRRLLENGANTSFVNRIYDPTIPVDQLIADPLEEARAIDVIPHPQIPIPQDLFRPLRQSSYGIDLSDRADLKALYERMEKVLRSMPDKLPWCSSPIISGRKTRQGEPTLLVNPALTFQVIGQGCDTPVEQVEKAMTAAHNAFEEWSTTTAESRAQILERLSDLLEAGQEELITLLVYEGGKTLPDAVSEVREAVDFCRYYACEARRLMSLPMTLPGPTGELNQLSLHGRGVIVCISPWNFPLAIFTGQVAAALAAGNCVIAKPAHQTPLVAQKVIQFAHQAGIPGSVLHFLPGRGGTLGEALMRDTRTAGVAFTGSTTVAQGIAKTLLSRVNTPIVPLIAETGGMNAMIVDSSALPEQVVQDIMASAFQSAGQRCSALRLLFVQEDIADNLFKMLKGAMAELCVGNPSHLSTDIGPVIDQEAMKSLQKHQETLDKRARLIYRVKLNDHHKEGSYFPPQAFELSKASEMTEEIFGPILHVVRFKGGDLDTVIDQINATGYGLTLGVHSRIEETIQHVQRRARVGNLYVNRSMIGAVVGVQPFGGEGLSGTGPKAGGPNYLQRFTVERTFSQDTTASGGNVTLLADLD